MARGHDVRIYTGRRYRDRVEATGAAHVAMVAGPDPGDADPEAFETILPRPTLKPSARSAPAG